MRAVYYNEFDGFACAWLRELQADNLIAAGQVDEKDVLDVVPNELTGFTQWHLFAGIGVWSAALRAAGWPDDREVFTVSCPCQPFSAAGKRGGKADERHLWPAAFHLISQIRPAVIFGEQVASKDGLAWFDDVSADLEAAGYTVGACVTCACGFGAPHIRQRLYFFAHIGVALGDSECKGLEGHTGHGDGWSEPGRNGARSAGHASEASGASRLADPGSEGISGRGVQRPGEGDSAGAWAAQQRPAGLCADGRLDNPGRTGDERRGRAGDVGCAPSEEQGEAWQRERRGDADCDSSADGRLGNSSSAASERHTGSLHTPEEGKHGAGLTVDGAVPLGIEHAGTGVSSRPGPVNGLWRVADWLYCRDAKWRAVESGTFPLADAGQFRNRVAELRGAGNALCIAQAQEFIVAAAHYLDGGAA